MPHDGLTPSKYLYETAKRNIDGEITIEETQQLIDSYETRQGRTEDEDDAEKRGSSFCSYPRDSCKKNVQLYT